MKQNIPDTQQGWQEIYDRYQSATLIAEATGMTPNAVYYRLQKFGVKRNPRGFNSPGKSQRQREKSTPEPTLTQRLDAERDRRGQLVLRAKNGDEEARARLRREYGVIVYTPEMVAEYEKETP